MKHIEESDIKVVRRQVERLGLDNKAGIEVTDVASLYLTFNDIGRQDLVEWVKSLKSPAELEDFIVNTIYG